MARQRATAQEWPALRRLVFQRDDGCVAVQTSKIGAAAATTMCRDKGGARTSWRNEFALEADHVQAFPTMGLKAPDTEEHLVTLCHFHHQGGWATANRDVERAYLRKLYPAHWAAEPCST